MDRKFRAVFSHRSATRLKRLSRPTPCSIRAGLVEGLGEESRLVFFVSLCGMTGLCRTPSLRPGWPCCVAFVADDGAGLDVGSDVEQGLEMAPVEGFAAGQVEGDDVPGGVRFCMDFRSEAATRATERLPVLPPFAPAADTARARWLNRTSE